MAGRIRSLLPTLSVSLPAIITGVLIFSDNKLDPIKALLSKSDEEKKEEEKIKGEKQGDKNSSGKDGKNKGKKSSKENQGDKPEDEGNGGEGDNSNSLVAGNEKGENIVNDSEVQEGDTNGLGDLNGVASLLESVETTLQGLEGKGQENSQIDGDLEEQKEGNENGDGQEQEVEASESTTVIGAKGSDGEARESKGTAVAEKRRPWAGAFTSFFGEISEDFLD